MKGEINKYFYCSTNNYVDGGSCVTADTDCTIDCEHCHRKHPTPDQFKEEYGEEYSDDGAIYILQTEGTVEGKPYWDTWEWGDAQEICGRLLKNEIIVCACTPFGKPAKDWRPR